MGFTCAIWQELTQTKEHEDGYNVMIGNTTELTTEAASIPSRTLYVPLQFWFNRHVGCAFFYGWCTKIKA